MMTGKHECLERATYCASLAEGQDDPIFRAFLEKLARQWAEAAKESQNRADDYLLGTA